MLFFQKLFIDLILISIIKFLFRYKAVRKLWRNLAIPDLKQNLSTFNWRKKNALPALKKIVPIKTDQIGKRVKKTNVIFSLLNSTTTY